MGTATAAVPGADAARLATNLDAGQVAAAQPGVSASPVEVQRSAEIVIATIGVVSAGVDTAKTIWVWWPSRRSSGATGTTLFSGGTPARLARVRQIQRNTTVPVRIAALRAETTA